jgi:hypothetical protein
VLQSRAPRLDPVGVSQVGREIGLPVDLDQQLAEGQHGQSCHDGVALGQYLRSYELSGKMNRPGSDGGSVYRDPVKASSACWAA